MSEGIPEVPVRASVPVRTILATIGLILATVVAVLFVMRVEQVLVWMLIALFFTVALYPLVDLVQRRMTWCRRSLATLVVFLVVFLVVVLVLGGLPVFAVPLATEGTQLAGQLPGIITDARAGRGPVGDLLERTNALQFVQNNQERISAFATSLGTPGAEPAARSGYRHRRCRHHLRAVVPGGAGRSEGGRGHAGLVRAAARRSASAG